MMPYLDENGAGKPLILSFNQIQELNEAPQAFELLSHSSGTPLGSMVMLPPQ